MTSHNHRCRESNCSCREFNPTPPDGWTLDATGPTPILTSADGNERVVLGADGSLSATYRDVQSAVPHVAAVFLLAVNEARRDSQ